MYVKVEPTGCCERDGFVQVRFDFFLNNGDYGYSERHVQVPERGMTKEEIDSGNKVVIPLVWQLNPFHTHFVYVSPTINDKELMDIGEQFMISAYEKWVSGQNINIRNNPVIAVRKTAKLKNECIAKVASIKSAELMRIKG